MWGAFAGSTGSTGRVGHTLRGATDGMCKTAGRAQARRWLPVTPKLYPIPHVSDHSPRLGAGLKVPGNRLSTIEARNYDLVGSCCTNLDTTWRAESVLKS